MLCTICMPLVPNGCLCFTKLESGIDISIWFAFILRLVFFFLHFSNVVDITQHEKHNFSSIPQSLGPTVVYERITEQRLANETVVQWNMTTYRSTYEYETIQITVAA